MAELVVAPDESAPIKLDDPNLSFIDKLEPDDPEVEEGDKKESGEKAEGTEGKSSGIDPEKEPVKEEEKEVKPEEKDEREEELRTLRQITREQKREIDRVAAALELTNKQIKDANLVSEVDEEKQKELTEFAAKRQEQLDNLLEVMKVNPKFEDVEEVVSQSHFDDMVEAMAKTLVSKEGGNVADAAKKIEAEIWAMKNPYKFMHETIKTYHPDYIAAPSKGDSEPAAGDKKPEGKEKLTVEKVASSIQEVGGGASGSGGWTAARIDAMDEDELDQVPKEIYEKFLRNELK